MNHRAFALRASPLIALVFLAAAPLAGCSGTSAGMAGLAPTQPTGTGTALGGVAPALMPGARVHRVRKNLLTESVLYAFQGSPNGSEPYAGLTNVNGTLYGTTYDNGFNFGDGVVFKVTQSGAETLLHAFAGGSDGANPRGGLVDVKGVLYGTTNYGGANNDGTVFKIGPLGAGYRVLHSFAGTDGASPAAGLTDVNGVLYGTTYGGGANNDGTVFKITTSGTVTVLHSFAGSDGANTFASLTDVNGVLYGTTKAGGANNDGTIFSIATSGSGFKVLHSFAGTDGGNPDAGLTNVQSTLYGTTYSGGASNNGTVFQIATSGSGYKVLYSFGKSPDGVNPEGQLIVLNGVLFGTTANGGSVGLGTIFQVLPNFFGSEAVLYSFGGGSDGANPVAGLTNVKGTLYGTTVGGGNVSYGVGTVYKLLL